MVRKRLCKMADLAASTKASRVDEVIEPGGHRQSLTESQRNGHSHQGARWVRHSHIAWIASPA